MAKKAKQEELTLGRALRAAKTTEELNAIVAKLRPEVRHAVQLEIKRATERIEE